MTKTTEQTSRSTFANARMLSEGSFTTPQGNVAQTIYVDLTGKLPPEALCVAKASEPQFDLRTADSVRLTRPGVFRETGEVLVKDEQEGRARTSTRETIEGPTGATTQMDRRVRAVQCGPAAVPREAVSERHDEGGKDAYRHVGIDVRQGLARLLHVALA